MTSTECFSVYIRTIFLCNKSLIVRFLTVDKGKKTKIDCRSPLPLSLPKIRFVFISFILNSNKVSCVKLALIFFLTLSREH